jgi:hypothetical protein
MVQTILDPEHQGQKIDIPNDLGSSSAAWLTANTFSKISVVWLIFFKSLVFWGFLGETPSDWESPQSFRALVIHFHFILSFVLY